MQLVQLLIPLFDNAGRRFDQRTFDTLARQLGERFGGVTAFVQSPAQGVWKNRRSGRLVHDEMILAEILVEAIDHAWWAAFRRELETRFGQEEIVIRAIACDRL